MSTAQAARVALKDFHPRLDTFRRDFIHGLSQSQKSIPPKYFYDAQGARLFEQICELEEYFPTRTELGILRERLGEIRDLCGPHCRLIEFGSGSSLKTRLLLDGLDRLAAYVPIDISREQLVATAQMLSERHPSIEIQPVCADYTQPFDLPEPPSDGLRDVVFFPGSTIGNFLPHEAVDFLRLCHELCGDKGAVLIGVGLATDPEVLEAAYNDRMGVTAKFNLNLLQRAQRELGAEVDVDRFRHRAIWDKQLSRIEMRLVSKRAQSIRLDDHEFRFREDEYITTEYSHKFTVESFAELAAEAKLHQQHIWTDPEQRFSVQYLTPA